jgi:hypothetical protein
MSFFFKIPDYCDAVVRLHTDRGKGIYRAQFRTYLRAESETDFSLSFTSTSKITFVTLHHLSAYANPRGTTVPLKVSRRMHNRYKQKSGTSQLKTVLNPFVNVKHF